MNKAVTGKLIFKKPTAGELKRIQLLCSDPFYQYVQTTRTIHKEVLDESGTLNPFEYVVHDFNFNFIGYLKGYFTKHSHDVWIQIMLVDTPYLHQGYGNHIVTTFIQQFLATKSYQHIYLTCHNDNRIGQIFWTQLGFIEIKSNFNGTHSLYKADLRSLLCTQKLLQH